MQQQTNSYVGTAPAPCIYKLWNLLLSKIGYVATWNQIPQLICSIQQACNNIFIVS